MGSSFSKPSNFPSKIPLYQEKFSNWSREIEAAGPWTCAPKTPDDVVDVVNWAKAEGYTVRARGKMHNWSPLIIEPGGPACPKNLVLVDTTKYLVNISVDTSSTPKSFTAEAGATMEAIVTKLEAQGLGLAHMPGAGDLTLGGVLAIGGHGAVNPKASLPSGQVHGTVSNAVLSLTAVVWDTDANQYVLQKFSRSDPKIGALLVSLGRTFVVEATLQVGENTFLRCESTTDIPSSEMFAAPGSSGRTFAQILDKAHGLEVILFSYTTNPWLKTWTATSKDKPNWSTRQVHNPYNYAFSDNLHKHLATLAKDIVAGKNELGPIFGHTALAVTRAGLVAENDRDLWGQSKNLHLYIKPTTLLYSANGYVITTKYEHVQRVIHELISEYERLVTKYQTENKFPVNGPIEIRVTGLDTPKDVLMDGAVTPMLSAVRPRPDFGDWDTAIWFDILILPTTKDANEFNEQFEAWVYSNFVKPYATARVEWSKGWAYTKERPWCKEEVIKKVIPNSVSEGQAADGDFKATQTILDKLDPFRIYTSPFLQELFPPFAEDGVTSSAKS